MRPTTANPSETLRPLRARTTATALAVAVTILAGGLSTSAPAAAQARPPTQAKRATEVPPRPSAPPVRAQARPATGDFEAPPPHPGDVDGHDRSRAEAVPEETTETRLSWRNPDGTRTDELALGPIRWRGPDGQWNDIDLAPVAGPDGSFIARSAERSPQLAARADGATTLPTPYGPVTLRRPGASPVAGQVAEGAVVYPGRSAGATYAPSSRATAPRTSWSSTTLPRGRPTSTSSPCPPG